MRRLDLQDTMLNTGMGGVLPELDDPTPLRHVLDVGYGTGGWLIQTALTYPMIEQLIGIDVSHSFIAHARSKAEQLGLVSFVLIQFVF